MLCLRTAVEADRGAIEELTLAAFGTREHVEFVRRIWRSDAYLPDLELVAEEDGRAVGHVLHSRGDVAGCAVAALGPLSVAPARQRTGIGGALLEEVMARVEAAGFPLIALLGHPSYYPRFGFEPGVPLGIRPLDIESFSDPDAFMVRRLSGYDPSLRGLFRYAWEL